MRIKKDLRVAGGREADQLSEVSEVSVGVFVQDRKIKICRKQDLYGGVRRLSAKSNFKTYLLLLFPAFGKDVKGLRYEASRLSEG